MTFKSWPADLTTRFSMRGAAEQPERNVREYPVDIGPPLRSRASSVPGDIISGRITCESAAEYEALASFYRDTLKDGILPFVRPHPRTGNSGVFKFESFALSELNGDIHVVGVTLRYLK